MTPAKRQLPNTEHEELWREAVQMGNLSALAISLVALLLNVVNHWLGCGRRRIFCSLSLYCLPCLLIATLPA